MDILYENDNNLEIFQNNCLADFESNAPVGSSASTILGFVIIALALATLCFCPPEI